MEILYILLGIVLVIIGVIGCIAPGLPGTPLNYLAVLILHFTEMYRYPTITLIILLIIVLLVMAIDYIVPAIGTKKFGGSKYGVYGSIIGLFSSFFIGWILGPLAPIAFLIFPFAGAFIGETINGRKAKVALKAAFGSVLGFFIGMGAKLIVAGIISYYFFKGVFRYFNPAEVSGWV